jgi:hypothetical protein
MAGSRNLDPKTRQIVWARSAGRCQFRNCNKPLIGDLIAGNRQLNKGYVAHVIADSPKGPRGDTVLSPKLANDPDNVMLLCDGHHREIDRERPADYPADVLRAMKRDHEDWVSTVLSCGPDSRSHVLQFSATIGQHETAIPMDECLRAMMPERTPASLQPIEIKIRGVHLKDSEPDYWPLELKRLRQGFDEQIKGRVERGDIRHLSVFGFAPMPLLMELGRLLSDIRDVTVHQRHREPVATWRWANDKPPMGITLKPGQPGPKKVALKLSISAPITDDRIHAVTGSDVSIWAITCDRPHNDVMRRPDDLSLFRTLARRAFEEIKVQHGEDAEVSVFPAVPVACAIEFGRAWQPKAHLGMEIFDQSAPFGFCSRFSFS